MIASNQNDIMSLILFIRRGRQLPERYQWRTCKLLKGSPKISLKNVFHRKFLPQEKFVQPQKWILSKDLTVFIIGETLIMCI